MAIPVHKTYIPLATLLIKHACTYVTKHRARIIEATTILDSSKTAAMTTAIDGVISACGVFELVLAIYEPHA